MRWIIVLAVTLAALAHVAPSRAASPLERHGCVGCHSLDGSARAGPTFAGIAGREREILAGGERVVRRVDRDAVARAVREPDQEIVAGFAAGVMPKQSFDDATVAELVDAVLAVPRPSAPPPERSMALLAVSAAAFVLLHIALASLPVRRRLVAKLGQGGYGGVFSLVALASFVGMIVGFRRAPYVELWPSAPWLRWAPNVAMPIAFVLFVCAVSTKSPTAAGPPGAPPVTEAVGVVRITRHPMLWSFALWGAAHLLPNGDLRCLVLFGAVTTLAVIGMFHIDARRAATAPEAWEPIARTTSRLPFAAILAGRNRLVLREIGLGRVLVGLAAWGASLALHAYVFGVPPYP